MVKTFITNISLQNKAGLEKVIYKPIAFNLSKNMQVAFPITPIIANNIQIDEEVSVIVVRSNNNDTPDNFEVFLEELKELGIGGEQIVEISVEENQGAEGSRALLLNILEAIPEDSLIFTDITYGTKPMSAILLYAMSIIEKVKDSEVQGIYYGETPRENGKIVYEKVALHDMTSLKFMCDMIEQLNDLDVKNPLASLKVLLQ